MRSTVPPAEKRPPQTVADFPRWTRETFRNDSTLSADARALPLRPPHAASRLLPRSFLTDVPIVFFSLLFAHAILAQPALTWGRELWSHVLTSDLGIVLLYAFLISILRSSGGPDGSSGAVLSRTVKAVGLATAAVAMVIRLSGGGTITSAMLAATALLNIAAMYLRDGKIRALFRNYFPRVCRSKRVLIIGSNVVGRELAGYLRRHPECGRTVAGFLDDAVVRGRDVLGPIENLSRVARTEFIDEVIISLPREADRCRATILAARKQHLDIQVVPELFDCSPASVRVENFGSIPLIPLHEEPIPSCGLTCKRLLDVGLSAVGLLLLLPLLVSIGVAIRLDSPGPMFYCAPRAGKKGGQFRCYKFRTMTADADGRKDALRTLNERQGPLFKITDDPRITRVGKWLRRYSLDELPQLWNVLIGDMSLVGPRPHPLDDYQRYSLEDLRRLDVTPGLTGAWQVSARKDSSFQRSMSLDLDYIENWNFWTDLRILWRTFGVVLRGTGV
jgi:exopolysaccharide biosynthesis polyprenyl glycosylphosphotransferase